MEKPPKVIYREPVNGGVFFELEEAKDGLIESSTDKLFDLLKDSENNYTKTPDVIWDNRDEIAKSAKRLITVLNDPEKLLTAYIPDGKA